MTQAKVSFAASASSPWWGRNAFRFKPPIGAYDPLNWRQAVLGHAMIRDFVAFLRHSINEPSPYYMQEHIDEQGQWFPLQPTLWALNIEVPPDALFPLPQPRPHLAKQAISNPWLITLDEELLYEFDAPKVFVPLGLMLTRLLPVSNRPIAQIAAFWLFYRVLPVCVQHSGPKTWDELDTMLSPVSWHP